jgi:hypothetical protein
MSKGYIERNHVRHFLLQRFFALSSIVIPTMVFLRNIGKHRIRCLRIVLTVMIVGNAQGLAAQLSKGEYVQLWTSACMQGGNSHVLHMTVKFLTYTICHIIFMAIPRQWMPVGSRGLRSRN